jgi:UDP-glucose 4-epimerase
MNLNNSRLLLVGGAGLVGSHIVDLLLGQDVREIVIFDNFVRGTRDNLKNALRDPRVRIIEGDICNREQILSAVQDVDGVFLLAALWLLQCAENPRAGLDVNVNGNFNVIDACRQAGVKRLVFSSSASVYGNALVEPMPEEHQLNNRTFYGATKVALEQMLRSYHEMYKLNYVALRYFNIYGPRQDYKNAYVSVIMKVLDRIDNGQPPIIFGDGSQAYDFIYVKDVARANVLAMQNEVTDEAFNISTGVKTSISALVSLLLEITGSSLRPDYKPAGQVFVTDRVGEPDKARRLLGFTAETPLHKGLEELVAWRAARIREEKPQ